MAVGEASGGAWQWLARRWFFAAVVALGTLLSLPSLGAGFVADDFIFINRLERTEPAPIWSLYGFADGSPGQHERLMQTRWVAFPWWVAEGFKVRFLRPLSSGLFALDHALFGHSPLGYHVHSVLWGVLLLLAVGLVLRAACSSRTWQLALLLYALCASRAESVGWISSRHMLVSTVPALFGLWALVTRVEAGRPGPRTALGVVGLLLGLAGGEGGLSVVCFWLAFELVGPTRAKTFKDRAFCALLPLGLMTVYALCYKLGRYGAAGSAAYLDPISAPLVFLQALPQRLCILLAEAFVGLSSGLATTTAPLAGALIGLVAALAVALALRWVWPAVEARDRRALAWLSLGAALALVVNAGAFLGSRLLLIPGLCTFVVIAILLRYGLPSPRGFARSSPGKAVAWLLAVVHLALAPLAQAANGVLLGELGAGTLTADRSLDAHFDRQRARTGKPPLVYVVSASDPFVGLYVAAARVMRLPASTGQWTLLSLAKGTHRVTRIAPNQLRLDVQPGMLHATFEGLFRSLGAPLHPGYRAAVADGFVTVLAAEAGRPTAISFTLSRGDFDDGEHVLIGWRDGRLQPIELAVGQALEIAWSPGPSGLL